MDRTGCLTIVKAVGLVFGLVFGSISTVRYCVSSYGEIESPTNSTLALPQQSAVVYFNRESDPCPTCLYHDVDGRLLDYYVYPIDMRLLDDEYNPPQKVDFDLPLSATLTTMSAPASTGMASPSSAPAFETSVSESVFGVPKRFTKILFARYIPYAEAFLGIIESALRWQYPSFHNDAPFTMHAPNSGNISSRIWSIASVVFYKLVFAILRKGFVACFSNRLHQGQETQRRKSVPANTSDNPVTQLTGTVNDQSHRYTTTISAPQEPLIAHCSDASTSKTMAAAEEEEEEEEEEEKEAWKRNTVTRLSNMQIDLASRREEVRVAPALPPLWNRLKPDEHRLRRTRIANKRNRFAEKAYGLPESNINANQDGKMSQWSKGASSITKEKTGDTEEAGKEQRQQRERRNCLVEASCKERLREFQGLGSLDGTSKEMETGNVEILHSGRVCDRAGKLVDLDGERGESAVQLANEAVHTESEDTLEVQQPTAGGEWPEPLVGFYDDESEEAFDENPSREVRDLVKMEKANWSKERPEYLAIIEKQAIEIRRLQSQVNDQRRQLATSTNVFVPKPRGTEDKEYSIEHLRDFEALKEYAEQRVVLLEDAKDKDMALIAQIEEMHDMNVALRRGHGDHRCGLSIDINDYDWQDILQMVSLINPPTSNQNPDDARPPSNSYRRRKLGPHWHQQVIFNNQVGNDDIRASSSKSSCPNIDYASPNWLIHRLVPASKRSRESVMVEKRCINTKELSSDIPDLYSISSPYHNPCQSNDCKHNGKLQLSDSTVLQMDNAMPRAFRGRSDSDLNSDPDYHQFLASLDAPHTGQEEIQCDKGQEN